MTPQAWKTANNSKGQICINYHKSPLYIEGTRFYRKKAAVSRFCTLANYIQLMWSLTFEAGHSMLVALREFTRQQPAQTNGKLKSQEDKNLAMSGWEKYPVFPFFLDDPHHLVHSPVCLRSSGSQQERLSRKFQRKKFGPWPAIRLRRSCEESSLAEPVLAVFQALRSPSWSSQSWSMLQGGLFCDRCHLESMNSLSYLRQRTPVNKLHLECLSKL